MPEEKAPSSGAFLPTALMYFCSGQPTHFCSGVDSCWWEAIPTDQTGDTFSLKWRDFPDMPKIAWPNVARHRLSLGLLYSNKQ